MTSHRRKPRRGRWLSPIDAEQLIAGDEETLRTHQRLTASGWTLKTKNPRPYLALDGFVSLRLVWRKRQPIGPLTYTLSYRIHASEVLAS